MPITIPARMVTATGVVEGELENISLSGAFIHCQETLEPGERVIVIAELPTNPSFNAHAEVVWSCVPPPDEEGTSRGIGVKFID
jgi:Tfp pilus assembly protein PilZ